MISKPLHVNIVNCHKYIFLTFKWLLIKEASTKQDLAMVCHYFSHTQEKEFKSTLSKPTYTYSGLLINITVPNINQSKVVFFLFVAFRVHLFSQQKTTMADWSNNVMILLKSPVFPKKYKHENKEVVNG